ncbi:hypothetical protein ASJ34_21425 [Xanthomonas campestris pv. campestris]|nr:hypothetical protein RT95_16410 [Xanthomonas campestris]PJR18215.1 hypothetical protein ASJ34_21425 [Xanthomonas campestris pv. campestris]
MTEYASNWIPFPGKIVSSALLRIIGFRANELLSCAQHAGIYTVTIYIQITKNAVLDPLRILLNQAFRLITLGVPDAVILKACSIVANLNTDT